MKPVKRKRQPNASVNRVAARDEMERLRTELRVFHELFREDRVTIEGLRKQIEHYKARLRGYEVCNDRQ